jgi:hypothetical protein
VLSEGLSQQTVMIRPDGRKRFPQLLEHQGATLDIGEKKGDGTSWE